MHIRKFKNWHFSVGALIVQTVFLIYWLVMAVNTPLPDPNDDLSSINAVPSILTSLSIVIMVLLLIPTILLKSNVDKRKNLGIILSRIFGAVAVSDVLLQLIGYVRFGDFINSYLILFGLQIIQAIFLFMAGRRQIQTYTKPLNDL